MSGLTVEKIVSILRDFSERAGEKIELILVGGLAMTFYGGSRPTADIDAEIKCSSRTYEEMAAYLTSHGVVFNIGEDISGWGVVPMPDGYRERTSTIHESSKLVIKILDPVDYVFAKLRRGTAEDISDIREVLARYNITEKDLKRRYQLIRLPKDTESSFFIKRFDRLVQEISPK